MKISNNNSTVIPASPYVTPAQAGIHKAVQGLTAHGFRLKATGMTGVVSCGMMRVVSSEMTGVVSCGMTKRAKVRMTRLGRKLQSGFTLLEMVLVLFLIGLMASATLMLTENVEDQAKYDETKRRMEMMRKAIVGDPTRTVNGSPEISGFVADMGRLPNCVRELLEQKKCDGTNLTPSWDIDASTGLGFGWRGPYIQVLPERNGNLRFRDGYGNSDLSAVIDAKNSGWAVFGVSATDISVASDSFNLSDAADDITVDPLIVSADWQIALPDPLSINFINRSSGDLPLPNPVKLVLRIYQSNLTALISGDDGINDFLDVASGAIPASSQQPIQFSLSSTKLPIGHHGYSIVCYEEPATGDPDDYVIFDGDCNAGNDTQNTSTLRSFSVVPRQNITLDWIIP